MFIYFLMSWFPGARESKIGQFLARIFEPILEPFRRIIPPIGMFDISSLVGLFHFPICDESFNWINSSVRYSNAILKSTPVF